MSFTKDGVSPAVGLLSGETLLSRDGTLRPTLKQLLILLILVGLIPAAAPRARAGHGARLGPQDLRSYPGWDLAVLAHSSGSHTIFVVDSRSRTILYREVVAEKDIEVWNLKDFKPLEMKGDKVPLGPTALAVNSTTLFVADYEGEAVFAVDLKTHDSRLLLQKPDIEKPVSIAVSESGRLAVGQDGENVVIYDPAVPSARPHPLPGQKIDDPVRLQFIPSADQKASSLLVLDSDKGGELTLYEPSGQDPDSYTPKPIKIPTSVASRLEERDDTSLDLAFNEGNFYLTEGRNWAVFSRLGLTSARWVLFPGMYRITPARLYAAGGSVFALNIVRRKDGVIERVEVLRLSLKQMTIRMEVTPPEANVLLAELYKALYEEVPGSLPEREYVVRSASNNSKRSLEELLKVEHVLAPGDYSPTFKAADNSNPSARPSASNPSALSPADSLENLLCFLNRDLNTWECPEKLTGPVKERRLPRQYGAGQALVIPGLGVEQAPYEGSVSLQGKTVAEAVSERLMDKNPLAKVTTEYLMRKDPAYYQTIDYELTRRGYILPSSFLQSFQPSLGSLLRIVQNQEQVVATPECQTSWTEVAGRKRSVPVPELAEKLRSYSPSLSYLPRKRFALSDHAVLAEWNRLGIVAIEMVFEGPVEERGSREALTAQAAPKCWESFEGKDAYVVGDVIRVSGAKFRLLLKDGEAAQLKQTELERWGIDALVDESSEWSFKVTEPYILAYRALPWDGQPLVREKQHTKFSTDMPEPGLRFVLDPHAIKPKSVQDIWAKTDGKFFLPGLRWDIKLLTDSSTLAEGSVIRKWAAKHPGKVYVWPTGGKSSDDTKPNTIVEGRGEPPTQEDLAHVTSNRDDLRKSIAFPNDVKSGGIIIGLMERTGSIQLLNPDFAWREIKIKEVCTPEDPCPWEFVWLEAPEDKTSPPERKRGTVPPVKRVVRTRAEIELLRADDYWKNNHGTHVAGLLASTYKHAQGLVPDAKIIWLQLGNPPVSLPEQVTQHDHHDLRVINVSQEFLADSYEWLEDQLDKEGTELKSKLFVVAAGNDGCDLNNGKCQEKHAETGLCRVEEKGLVIKPPVIWLHRFNNLLSVSATDMDHKLLFKDDCRYRVNYGVRYVDLLAPGYEIYSSTEKSAYAATTGTSQAAPLVTATAAVLAKKIVQNVDPSLLKGRLIYTADWEGRTLEEREKWDPKDSYLERVWGGSLNAGRALFGLDRDIFLYEYGKATRHRAIHDLPDKVTLIIKNRTKAFFVRQPKVADEPITAALSEADSKIEFGQVLRMTRLKNGFYRIIYKSKTEPWNLRIIMNASIEPGTPMKNWSYEEIVGDTFGEQKFSEHGETLRLDKIIDYVGSFSRMGSRLRF